MGIVYGLDDFLEIFDMRVLKCFWGSEFEDVSIDYLIKDIMSKNSCEGVVRCCVFGLGCGSLIICFLGLVIKLYIVSLNSSLLNFEFFGWVNDLGFICDLGLKLIDYIF